MTNIEIETPTLAKTALRKYIADEINWEQRRYEIAKEVLPRFFEHTFITPNKDEEEAAKIAVSYADALIKELKGEAYG